MRKQNALQACLVGAMLFFALASVAFSFCGTWFVQDADAQGGSVPSGVANFVGPNGIAYCNFTIAHLNGTPMQTFYCDGGTNIPGGETVTCPFAVLNTDGGTLLFQTCDGKFTIGGFQVDQAGDFTNTTEFSSLVGLGNFGVSYFAPPGASFRSNSDQDGFYVETGPNGGPEVFSEVTSGAGNIAAFSNVDHTLNAADILWQFQNNGTGKVNVMGDGTVQGAQATSTIDFATLADVFGATTVNLSGYLPLATAGSYVLWEGRVGSTLGPLTLGVGGIGSVFTAGTGAGNMVVKVVDATASSTTCTHNLACTTSTPSVFTCSGTGASANDIYQLVVDTSACSTGPAANFQVQGSL